MRFEHLTGKVQQARYEPGLLRGLASPDGAPRVVRIGRPWSRRAVLRAMIAGGCGALLTACGGDDFDPFAASRETAPPPNTTAPAEAEPQSAAQAAPAAEAPAQQQAESAAQTSQAQAAAELPPLPQPLVYVIPSPARQGHAVLILVHAPGAERAAIAWLGETFSLIREDDRFMGFIGIDANAPPGPQALSVAVWAPNGQQLLWQETLIEIDAEQWTTDDIQIDPSNAALLDPAVRATDHQVRLPYQTGLTPQRHWLGVFDPPSEGGITALYGEQRSFNGGPITEYHTGIDFGGESGSPVTAANSGIVSWAGRTERRGNGLIIDHGAGVFSGYYHLSEVLQTAGAVVEQGSLIARMGATGLATGPHLHWEVVVRGITVNPLPWLRNLEFPDPNQELNPANAITATNLAAG